MKSSRRSNRVGAASAFVVGAVLLFAGVLGFLFRQDIKDLIEGASFHPSSAIVEIESEMKLTPAGKRIFYATAPEVVAAETFNEVCPRQESASPIVGCYTPQDAIFIYDVTNEKLDGIKEVTASHELLHAVWVRMSVSERESIGAELQAVYNEKADSELRQRMSYYERTEKGQEQNELHSILATEMPELSSTLEAHYKKYLDRHATVAQYKKYSMQYQALETKVATIQKEMSDLATQVEGESARYNQSRSALDADTQSFNTRARSGQFTSQAAFSAERQQLVARGAALDVQRKRINADIDSYNQKYAEYKSIAEEIQLMNRSLDSMKALEEATKVDRI